MDDFDNYDSGPKICESDAFLLGRQTIVIPDVHSSLHWKSILQHRKKERVVFLGDYFDNRGNGPFASSAAQNFLEICEYAREHSDTHLLVGNHDYDRIFHPSQFHYSDQKQEVAAILKNMDILDMIFVDENAEKPCIFSHGGLCATFMRLNEIVSVNDINATWYERPTLFDFIWTGPNGMSSARDGDDPWQPPTWARLTALQSDGIAGYNQVVGHTSIPGDTGPAIFSTVNGDIFLATCTHDNTLIRLN